MRERKLAAITVELGIRAETQSGLQMLAPRIYGAYEEPNPACGIAAIVMHPTSNFMGHYLISELAARGICCMGLNSRYVSNDATLLMERALQDLGAGVRFLKDRGYEKIVLVGNSGGAALVSFYQAEAEHPRQLSTPAGDPVELGTLLPADGIVLCAAHAGRARVMAEWIDPAVIDECDPLLSDCSLDIYGGDPTPPFAPDFVADFRHAQLRRRNRIETWVWERLNKVRRAHGADADEAFVIHRTHADPRLIDLSLDRNDRPLGSIWGDARKVNVSANAVGRYTTLKSFLSQWASVSQADGPKNLSRTSTPVLFFDHTADASTFPSTAALWLQAGGDRVEAHVLKGANHYLAGQPHLVKQLADTTVRWCAGL